LRLPATDVGIHPGSPALSLVFKVARFGASALALIELGGASPDCFAASCGTGARAVCAMREPGSSGRQAAPARKRAQGAAAAGNPRASYPRCCALRQDLHATRTIAPAADDAAMAGSIG